MKIRLVLFITALLLVFSFPAAAQDVSPDNKLVGSTWTSQKKVFKGVGSNNPFVVSPDQTGLGGVAEAIVGMSWYQPVYNIVGTAKSKILSGSSTYNVCAQVSYVKRDGVNNGGSSRVCGEIGVGGSKQADYWVWENWNGATWVTQSWHEFSRTGSYWSPILSVTKVL